MLRQRAIVVIIALPIGITLMVQGGVWFAALVAIFLGLAAWEYTRLFRVDGYQPNSPLVVAGVLLLVVGRHLDGFESAPWMLSLIILALMSYHMFAFERGRDKAASDFVISLGGVLYIGWMGSYLVSLRSLDDGFWWLLVVLPAIWWADMGAYFLGKRFGRRKLSPRLSPGKTWFGYLSGIPTAILGTVLLTLLWYRLGLRDDSAITLGRAGILGVVLSVAAPLGDLGESMFKRQVGEKDSSNLIPGHGGFFDRIDSWLWAAVIGFYIIVWFFI